MKPGVEYIPVGPNGQEIRGTLKTDFEIIAAACRENTGAHMLDSGSAYGRHWQRPPILETDRAVTLDIYERGGEYDITATIETAHFLAERCEVRREIHEQFNQWVEGQDGDWFEVTTRFCEEVLQLHRHARDNVYDQENDLSQVFVWEVWSDKEEESDWIYAHDALLVVFVYTGYDVRGGYAAPLFLKHMGDYACPVDFVAGFGCAEARLPGGGEPDSQRLDEHWLVGWSSCPSARVSEDVERVFWHGPDWFIATLKTGEIVKVYAVQPFV